MDDKHIHPKDAGYKLGFLDPEIEIAIIPKVGTLVCSTPSIQTIRKEE